MALYDDLKGEVNGILAPLWDTNKGYVIPAPEDLLLNANQAREFASMTVAYADIDGSTSMVDTQPWWFAAEVYKCYLRCASQILKSEGGAIAAYDGDRVMAVFIGPDKENQAVRAALKINTAVLFIINPALTKRYPEQQPFTLKHVVGIDSSPMRVARVGVHADNDLVWIGRAANHAAKLCSRSGTPTWITKSVYDALMGKTVTSLAGINMWIITPWTEMSGAAIYGNTHYWTAIE
jgi:class 3 adenylate cyclase